MNQSLNDQHFLEEAHMFEFTTTHNAEQLEVMKFAEQLHELADLQLAFIGGGAGAASLD
jgi:hypothetical protein